MYFDFGLEKHKNNNENHRKLSLPYMTSNSNTSITDLYTYLVIMKENTVLIYLFMVHLMIPLSAEIILCLKVGW